jgi:flagellar hook assembly protein FlgD
LQIKDYKANSMNDSWKGKREREKKLPKKKVVGKATPESKEELNMTHNTYQQRESFSITSSCAPITRRRRRSQSAYMKVHPY